MGINKRKQIVIIYNFVTIFNDKPFHGHQPLFSLAYNSGTTCSVLGFENKGAVAVLYCDVPTSKSNLESKQIQKQILLN